MEAYSEKHQAKGRVAITTFLYRNISIVDLFMKMNIMWIKTKDNIFVLLCSNI